MKKENSEEIKQSNEVTRKPGELKIDETHLATLLQTERRKNVGTIPPGAKWIRIDEIAWIDIAQFFGIKIVRDGVNYNLHCSNENGRREFRCSKEIVLAELNRINFPVEINNAEENNDDA